jgi:hypothetical protein
MGNGIKKKRLDPNDNFPPEIRALLRKSLKKPSF